VQGGRDESWGMKRALAKKKRNGRTNGTDKSNKEKGKETHRRVNPESEVKKRGLRFSIEKSQKVRPVPKKKETKVQMWST